MNNAGLNTKLGSCINKTIDFIGKTGINPASKIVPSTSCAQFDMQWSLSGIKGMGVGPDTGYGLASLAKQLNSESVKK